MTDPDADDAWGSLDDLVALHSAGDVAALHRRLVLYPAGPTNPSDAFEPWCLFQQFHKDDPAGAVTTALLLVTDRRWRRATGRLIGQIDESGLIAPGDLDVLAQTFVSAGRQVYWEVPGEWFGAPVIIVDIGRHPDEDEPDDAGPDDDSEEGPVVVARDVRPPLRRWAARRIVRADPSTWSRLVTRARELDPRGGAAVVRGVLDGVDGLTRAARAAVLDLAATWPQRDVREAAAELDTTRARDGAAPKVPVPEQDRDPGAGGGRASLRRAAQPSLF